MIEVEGGAPRRGFIDDDLVDPIEDITNAAPARARRGRRARRLGKGAIAGLAAGALAVGTLFGYAFLSRDGQDASMESVDADQAVPAAAIEAAKLGFADRTKDASRSALREGVTGVTVDENARERTEALGDAADEALESESKETAQERERLMNEDLKLVEKQAAQLKKEAEEAARRLAAARNAAANKDDGAPADAEISEQDVSNLNSSGGSLPVKSNYRIGAGFGQRGVWARYHTGQDFPAPTGTPVYAAAAGVVISPTHGGWAGTNVVIQHKPGATLYAHLSRRVVSPGETVKPGQLIGYVGTTGRSFGPHLHFEYYKNGTTPGDVYSASNPMTFLRSLGVH